MGGVGRFFYVEFFPRCQVVSCWEESVIGGSCFCYGLLFFIYEGRTLACPGGVFFCVAADTELIFWFSDRAGLDSVVGFGCSARSAFVGVWAVSREV
jgi:hypothetical protein